MFSEVIYGDCYNLEDDRDEYKAQQKLFWNILGHQDVCFHSYDTQMCRKTGGNNSYIIKRIQS